MLSFELFIVFLIGLTLFGLKIVDPAWMGLVIGGAGCLTVIVALGFMRVRNVGIIIGWGVHLLYFAGGFLFGPILLVGLIFTSLWVYCLWKGAHIDRTRAGRIIEESSSI